MANTRQTMKPVCFFVIIAVDCFAFQNPVFRLHIAVMC